MNNIKISFCLPVYNVSNYLKYCFDSIFKVKGINFEIICVDDCSTDSSYAILQDYASKYDFIKVHKNEKNSGVSYTRNCSIELASGEYIWFVDPDDLIVAENIMKLYEIAVKENLDVATGNFLYVSENQATPISTISDFGLSNDYTIVQNEGQIVNYYATNETGKSIQGCWIGLFRRSFILENKLFFENELSLGEDSIWHYGVLRYLKKWARFDGVCYNYRIREQSACTSYNQARNIKVYKNYKNMHKILTEWQISGNYNPPDMCNNYETLCLKIDIVKQNIANTLAMIKDKEYVKKELASLKEEKLYPYPFRKQVLKEEKNFLKRMLLYFLPLKPVFWIMHFLYSRRKNKE